MPVSAEPGYYNSFDPAKRYFEVRTLAGMVPQSQEQNIVQAIAKEMVKRLADFFFQASEGKAVNGRVLTGGGFSRDPDNELVLRMKAATFYYDGIIHTVDAKNLTITNDGNESIGIKVTETVITPTIAALAGDTSLYDPSVGELNEGFEGANRLKIECVWTVDDDTAIEVYKFLDGVQQEYLEVGRIDPVVELLAKRTYDESGNYVVSGFNVDTQPIGDDSGEYFHIKVGNFDDTEATGSTAYVQGNQIIQIVPQYILAPKATSTAAVARESWTYTTASAGDPTGPEQIFTVANQPLAAEGVDSVYATFGVLRQISNHGTTDALPLNVGETVDEVMRVYFDAGSIDNVDDPDVVYLEAPNTGGPGAWRRQGNNLVWDIASQPTSAYDSGETYAYEDVVSHLGTVFQSKTAGNLGNTPAPGSAYWQEVSTAGPASNSTYFVYMRVNRALTSSEYVITDDGTGIDISDLATKPYDQNLITGQADESDIVIDYRYYLSRIDIPFLKPDGRIGVASGGYAVNPVAPPIEGGVLPLAQILVRAGAGPLSTTVVAYNNKRLTMLELRKLQERVDRQEYNQAIADLNNDALSRASNNSATLRGIVTENFVYTVDDLQTGSNVKFERVAGTTSDDSIDVSKREFSLPETYESEDLIPDGDYDGGSHSITRDEDGTYYAEAVQDIKTNTIAINSFDGYIAPPVIALSSSIGTSEVNNTVLATYNPGSPQQVIKNYVSNWAATPGESLNQANFVSAGRFYDFMKPVWVWLCGSGFAANTLIEIRFDGRGVYLSNSAPAGSGLGAWSTLLGEATRPASTIVTYTGGVQALSTATLLDGRSFPNVAPPTAFVKTTSTGKFGVAVLVPEGVAAGSVAVVATELTAGEASAQTNYTAGSQVKTVDSTWKLYDEFKDSPALTARPVPVITSLEVLNADTGVAVTGNNLTTPTSVKLRLKWDTSKGGTASEVIFTITTSQGTITNRVLMRTLASNPSEFAVAGECTYLVPVAVTEAFRVQAIASNSTGPSNGPLKVDVSFNGVTNSSGVPSIGGASLGSICRGGSSTQKVNIVNAKNVATIKWKTNNQRGRNIYEGTVALTPSAEGTSHEINVRTGPGGNDIYLVGEGVNTSFGTTPPINIPWFDAKSDNGKPKVDPLSEVFLSNQDHDMLVQSVAVSFATKPAASTAKGVTLEIREVDGSVASRRTVTHGTAIKTWADIVTNDGTTGAETEFVFDSPVLLRRATFYAIVLLTGEQEYTVHIATLGATDLATDEVVKEQPYAAGVLAQSANDLTWEAIPESDLYFRIKCKKYSLAPKTIEFEPITGSNMVGFRLEPTYLLVGDPQTATAASEISWSYTQDDDETPIPFSPYSNVYFPFEVASSITIRAELSSRGSQATKISPILNRKDIEIKTFTRGLESLYVSKTLDMAGNPYRYVRMIAKMVLPTSAQTATWFVTDNTSAPNSVIAYNPSTNYAINAVVSHSSKNWLARAASGPGNGGAVTPVEGAVWTQAETFNNVVWRIVPPSGQPAVTSASVTAVNNSEFSEYERIIDLGENGARDEFAYAIKLTAATAADTLRQPRFKDVINILND